MGVDYRELSGIPYSQQLELGCQWYILGQSTDTQFQVKIANIILFNHLFSQI